MIQIIKRREGQDSEIQTLDKGRPQISYNSDGHVVIRIVHDQESDSLIVLDQHCSSVLRGFISAISESKKDFMPF